MNSIEKKRIRSSNFSQKEKETLLNLVCEKRDIIENKQTNHVSVQAKLEAWKNITSKFNAMAPNSCHRNLESLKKFYDNQKKDLRKREAEKRKQMYLTGGGTPINVTNEPTDDLLLSMVNKKSICGVNTEFDSDGPSCSNKGNNWSNDSNIEIVFENSMTEHISEEMEDGESVQSDLNLESENNPVQESDVSIEWKKYKPSDLQKPISSKLKRNRDESQQEKEVEKNGQRKKLPLNRRRPHTTVKALSSSSIGQKYEILLDKKIQLATYQLQKIKDETRIQEEEHQLRVTALNLDIEMRKKELKK